MKIHPGRTLFTPGRLVFIGKNFLLAQYIAYFEQLKVVLFIYFQKIEYPWSIIPTWSKDSFYGKVHPGRLFAPGPLFGTREYGSYFQNVQGGFWRLYMLGFLAVYLSL